MCKDLESEQKLSFRLIDDGSSFINLSDYEEEIPRGTKLAAIKRDLFTCQYCGFQSLKYQQVIVKNRDFHNIDSYTAACIFCAQYFQLNFVPLLRSGRLIWLPEVAPARLNSILKEIYVERITRSDWSQPARDALEFLNSRHQEVIARLGSDDLDILVERLKNGELDGDRLVEEDGIRLMPIDRRIIWEADLNFNQFPQILAFWRSKNGPLRMDIPRKYLQEFVKEYPNYDS